VNERMIELANKANEDIGYTFKMEDAKQLHELMEKFGKLIANDVAQFVEDKFDFCGDEIVIAEKIREQYGVEK